MVDFDKFETGVRVLARIDDAVNASHLSYIALGVFMRIADDDERRMTARELAAGAGREDEQTILAALQELEQAGFVRLRGATALDGASTTAASVVFNGDDGGAP